MVASQVVYENSWFQVLNQMGYFSIENRQGQVAVLATLPDERVIFVKVKRPLMGQDLWELPAGGIEFDEGPLQAAMRELREEAGVVVADPSKWSELGGIATMPNRFPEYAHVLEVDVPAAAWEGRDGHDDEITAVAAFSPLEIKRLLLDGELKAALPIAIVMRKLCATPGGHA